MKTLTQRVLVIFAGIDFVFGLLITPALLQLIGAKNWSDGALLMGAMLCIKIIAWSWLVVRHLAPYEAFVRARDDAARKQRVPGADRALQTLPRAFALWYVGSWVLQLGLAYLIMAGPLEPRFEPTQGSALAMVFVLCAAGLGAFPLVFPLIVLLTAKAAGQCSVFARENGIFLDRSSVSLQQRIGLVSVCFALGPMCWMAAVGHMAQANMQQLFGSELGARAGEVSRAFLMNAGVFSLIIALWAPLCAVAFALAISQPLAKLSEATREIVEEGNQTRMNTLPIVRNDEVGLLSERYNELLEMMRDLSQAAEAIALGNLMLRIDRQGELPDAFARMTAGLQNIVLRIRQTAVELGSAATEILAASQEQETAATSLSSAMTEISHTMDSLSGSAAHVSDSVGGVLSNAEQTLQTTDSMVDRIEALSTHTGRIGELLDTIRDIADKSDLLALNGSLEASRAGDGGQGFALVATEMRRLAERVTASVEDVKVLVVDIRSSSASTIMATEESRRLARETTEAARQITIVTQQQRSGTEQVSESVREITNVVTQSAAATSQTRTSAEGLKEQADALSGLVQQFQAVEETG